MSLRFTDTEKWKDPWFRRLSREGKVLFEWIRDNCDTGGFLEFDEEIIADDMRDMTPAEVGKAVQELSKPYRGVSKVLVKGQILWSRNFVKSQHKGVELRSEVNYQRSSIRALSAKLSDFPEVKMYFVDGKALTNPYEPLQKGTGEKRRGEVGSSLSVSKRDGECEGGDDEERWRGKDPQFDMILDTPGLTTKYEVWLRLKESYPNADAKECVNLLIFQQLNGTLKSEWGYLISVFRRSDKGQLDQMGDISTGGADLDDEIEKGAG